MDKEVMILFYLITIALM